MAVVQVCGDESLRLSLSEKGRERKRDMMAKPIYIQALAQMLSTHRLIGC